MTYGASIHTVNAVHKERSRFGHGRNRCIDHNRCVPGHHADCSNKSADWKSIPYCSATDFRNYRIWLIKSGKGSAAIDFLIISMLFFFLVFVTVDFFVTTCQYLIANHIMQNYKLRIALNGCLSADDENQMIDRFREAKIIVQDVYCQSISGVSARAKESGSVVVLKNPANADASTIILKIYAKPYDQSFMSGLLIGAGTAPDCFQINVGGDIISEKPPF